MSCLSRKRYRWVVGVSRNVIENSSAHKRDAKTGLEVVADVGAQKNISPVQSASQDMYIGFATLRRMRGRASMPISARCRPSCGKLFQDSMDAKHNQSCAYLRPRYVQLRCICQKAPCGRFQRTSIIILARSTAAAPSRGCFPTILLRFTRSCA